MTILAPVTDTAQLAVPLPDGAIRYSELREGERFRFVYMLKLRADDPQPSHNVEAGMYVCVRLAQGYIHPRFGVSDDPPPDAFVVRA
jgi:hypothetical protein